MSNKIFSGANVIAGKLSDGTPRVLEITANGAMHQFASATSSGPVTKSDATVLDFNAIWVGGEGNVAIKHTEGGSAVTYIGVVAGTVLPVAGVRVMETNTTATNMVWMKW